MEGGLSDEGVMWKKLVFILIASPPVVMTLSDVSQPGVFLLSGLGVKEPPELDCAETKDY